MNEEVSQQDMCKSCCVKEPPKKETVLVTIICDNKKFALNIDTSTSKMYQIVGVTLEGECTISLYKTTPKSCRLVLFNSNQSNLQERKVINEIIDQKKQQEWDTSYLEIGNEKEWGETIDGHLISSTYTMNFPTTFYFAYVELIDAELGVSIV